MGDENSIFCELLTGDLLAKICEGNRTAVLCSRTVWQKTHAQEAIQDLGNSCDIKVYTHVRPNAPLDDVTRVANDYPDGGLDSVVAIGGGSIIDAAKALSVCFGGRSLAGLFAGNCLMPSKSIPVVAVPTTAGTGAEASYGAILFDSETQKKHGIRSPILKPRTVIVDPTLHLQAPRRLRAEVGFDCLTHAIETFVSKKSNALTRYRSIAAIKTIFDSLGPCVEGSFEDMERMAIASLQMGHNLAQSSTCLPHRIQYSLGPATGTSHAEGLIALYKGWLPVLCEGRRRAKLDDLCDCIGFDAAGLISHIETLKQRLDIDYSLSSLGMLESQIQRISSHVTGNCEADPAYEGPETIRKILQRSL